MTEMAGPAPGPAFDDVVMAIVAKLGRERGLALGTEMLRRQTALPAGSSYAAYFMCLVDAAGEDDELLQAIESGLKLAYVRRFMFRRRS